MPVKKQEITFQIPAPNIQIMKVKILGTAPLLFHKWDEKAIRMILDKQMKKAQKGREVRDPEKEYKNSFYYNEEGYVSIPARNLKQAVVGSARFIQGVPMTILRGAVFITGDVNDWIPVLIKNKPISRADVEKNKGKWLLQSMVTVGMGSADIRFRGQIPEGWSAEFIVKFDADLLSSEQILNLIQRAGFSQGLMEQRPERGGSNGTFEILNK